MKIYIPTTILNLSEILATDSISPSAFYKNRSFGSNHWCDVEEECYENVLLLYTKPFQFSRPKSDMEDRPMLICTEVEDDLPEWQEGILYSDHTLYFDWTTHFIFYSKEDKQVAISLANVWDTTKMLGIYQKLRMTVVSENLPLKSIDAVKQDIPLNTDSLKYDYEIDKAKGAMYGYYIGATLSTTPFSLGFLEGMQRVYESMSSAIASASPLGKDANRLAITLKDDTKSRITQHVNKMRALQLPLSTEKHEFQMKDLQISTISNEYVTDDFEQQLLLVCLNEVIQNKKWGTCVNAIKAELADEITDIAKLLYANEWEDSYTRKYMNCLRRHIIAGEPFTEEWNNGILSSVAAFLLKGDDWEQMLSYMRSRGMYDYRLAFAIYGSFHGFASLWRNFTNIIFDQEKQYVGLFYGEVYTQLFRKEIPKLKSKGIVQTKREDTEVLSWRSGIVKFVTNLKNIKKRDELLVQLKHVLDEIGDTKNDLLLLNKLSNRKGWEKKNKPWKSLKEWLNNSQTNEKQMDLFDSNSK